MKFYLQKALIILCIIVLTNAIKEKFQFKKIPNGEPLMNKVNSEQNSNTIFRQNRFNQVSNRHRVKTLEDELNIFIINTNIGIKTNAPPGSQEQEVFPTTATSNTFYQYSWRWWKNIFYYPPVEAINRGGSWKYWMSKNGVTEDYIEFFFATPTKLNSMSILWRLFPKRYKVEFRVSDGGKLIPVTEMQYKYKDIEDDGRPGSISKVLDTNSLMFQKPIFAKSVKISMWDPLKSEKFSIFKVKFWNQRDTLLIVNKMFDSCKNYCFYVNTDKPIDGSRVQAADCLGGMSTADNRELWMLNSDNSVVHKNSGLCLSEDMGTHDVILKGCGPYNPFKINVKTDDTLSFRGYEKDCLVMDTSTNQTLNFINDKTELSVTSEYDDEVYKRGNISMKTGDNFWMSIPGQTKQTFIINFGKRGPENWETLKVDKILIEWIYKAVDYRIFAWSPGSTWQLVGQFKNNTGLNNELNFSGIKCSAIMIQMDKANTYPELDKQMVYGIKRVYIGSYAYRMMVKDCDKVSKNSKLWDLDNQHNTNIAATAEFNKVYDKHTNKQSTLISIYKRVKSVYRDIYQKKELSINLEKDMREFKNDVLKRTVDNTTNYQTSTLQSKSNKAYWTYVETISKIDSKNNLNVAGSLGSAPKYAGTDCVHMKILYPKMKSGFYWIKPQCVQKAYKIWCDFSLMKGATVDIMVWSGDRGANSDLSDWKIRNSQDVGFECAKIGLRPLEMKNQRIIARSKNLINYLGYDMEAAQVIPFGYDFGCDVNECRRQFRSFNNHESVTINAYFQDDLTSSKDDQGPMAGIGFGNIDILKVFKPAEKKITAILCSSNQYGVKKSNEPKFLDCYITFNEIQSEVKGEKLVMCSNACNVATGPLYGDNIYDGKSSICMAAVHNSKVGSEGGMVKIKSNKMYDDTTTFSVQNGMASTPNPVVDSYGFQFVDFEPDCPIDEYKALAKKTNYTIPKIKPSSFLETGFKTMTNSKTESGSSSSARFNNDFSELEGVDEKELKEAGFLMINGKPVLSSSLSEMEQMSMSKMKFKEENDNNPANPTGQKAIDETTQSIGKTLGTLAAKAQESNPAITPGDLKKQTENMMKTGSDAVNNLGEMQKSLGQNVKNAASGVTPDNNYVNPADELKKQKSNFMKANGGDPDIVEQAAPKHDPSLNCTPTTPSGYLEVDKMFKDNFGVQMDGAKKQLEHIEKYIKDINEAYSFANNGKTSIENLHQQLHNTNIYIRQMKTIMYEVTNEATHRLISTEEIYEQWKQILIDLMKFRNFLLSYKASIKDQFRIINLKLLDDTIIPSWALTKEEIKGRTQAIGIAQKAPPVLGIAGSLILLKDRISYDFKFSTDMMVSSSSGKCGIVFRFKNVFNYYALVFDLDAKTKSVVVVKGGNPTTLAEIGDGAIKTNDWHTITIKSSSNIFLITLKNLSTGGKIEPIRFDDGTYASGATGYFQGDSHGFVFDNTSIESRACWKPWDPRHNLQIITSSTQYYEEQFHGKVTTRYDITDSENATQGPSKWKLYMSDSPFFASALRQESYINDASDEHLATRAILKDIKFQNGHFKTVFYPLSDNGIISFFFRYNHYKTLAGDETLSYYVFEMRNLNNGEQREFVLKKFQIDTGHVLHIEKSDIGYLTGSKHVVDIQANKNIIIVKASFNDGPMKVILRYSDNKYIKYGNVGVGTLNTPVNFNVLTTFPFSVDITGSEIGKYNSSPIDLPYFPQWQPKGGNPNSRNGRKGDNNGSGNNGDNGNSNGDGNNGNESTAGNENNGQGGNISSGGKNNFETCPENKSKPKELSTACIANNTNEKRRIWCRKTKNFIAEDKCVKEYCPMCCAKENPNDQDSYHKCNKTCILAPVHDDDLGFFKQCWQPVGEAPNTVTHCGLKFDNPVEQQTCKRDFCILCCAVRDTMFAKHHTLDTVNQCQSKCNEKYQDIPTTPNLFQEMYSDGFGA